MACLHELGCDVQTATLWDRLDTEELVSNPPSRRADRGGGRGRRRPGRPGPGARSAEPLQEVPVLIGVTLNALSRLDASDGFDDFALMPYVPPELYMRIRRIEWSRSEFAQQERIKMGPLCIDLAAHEVTIDGRYASAHASGVRAPQLPLPEPRPRVLPPAAPRARLGRRLLRQQSHRGHSRPAASDEARPLP